MSKIQFERLRKDLVELQEYIGKVQIKGNSELLSKLTRKREFLSTRLEQIS